MGGDEKPSLNIIKQIWHHSWDLPPWLEPQVAVFETRTTHPPTFNHNFSFLLTENKTASTKAGFSFRILLFFYFFPVLAELNFS